VPKPLSPKPSLTLRLKELLSEFGPYAVWTYFGIFATVFVAFVLAIRFGFHPATTAGSAGVFGSAYLATKLTQPLRIAATLFLTPIVVKLTRYKAKPPCDQSKTESSPNATDVS
jgi:hypothetical protein